MAHAAYFREHHIGRWEDAKSFVRRLGAGWVFRGQSDSAWPLASALERLDVSDKAAAEHLLVDEFARKSLTYLQPHLVPTHRFGWLALMQHYGAPTRLQDWTHSPYIAAFFAVERPMAPTQEAVIWAVNTGWVQGKIVDRLTHYLERFYLHNDPDDPTGWWCDAKALDLVHLKQNDLVNLFWTYNPFAGIAVVEPWIYDSRQAAQQAVFLCPADAKLPFVENLMALGPKRRSSE
jgi:hypothetical protein